MRNKITYILLASLVLILSACGGSNRRKGNLNVYSNPYSAASVNLKGPVKSVTRLVYKNNAVSLKEKSNYDPDGLLTSKVSYSGYDSTVTTYTYDHNRNLTNIEGGNFANYESRYDDGLLMSESVKLNKGGYTTTYQYKSNGEILSKTNTDNNSQLDYRYDYTLKSDGNPAYYDITYPGGKVVRVTYGDELITEEVDKKGTGNFKPWASYTLENDTAGNWIVKRGLTTGDGSYRKYYERRIIEYYPQAEAKSATAGSTASASLSGGSTATSGSGTPSSTLMIVIVVLSVLTLAGYLYVGQDKFELFSNFGGEIDENGMKRMWMYNAEPYKKMLAIFLIMIAAFLSVIIAMLVVGLGVWLLFWIVKIFFWAIIVIGYILLIGGIVSLFFGGGCYGIAAAVVGGLIVGFQSTLKEWGEAIVALGQQILDYLNVVEWTVSIFTNYGTLILAVIATPISIFLSLSILLIVLSFILRGFEFAALKIYNVNRPCPVCGNKDSFTYVIDGHDHPVPLHPGLYGIFHQTNHLENYRVPTMLLNGKAKLTRRCDNCGSIINAKKQDIVGTDLHIGFVGERSSGKSYLLYSALELLCADDQWKECTQVDAARNNKITDMTERIHNNDGIQTTVRDRYKAIQILLRTGVRPVPYHLFFYDVAGEKFNIKNLKHNALEFYQNVSTIVYVLDPTMVDVSGASPSSEFEEWQKKGYADTEKYNPEDTIASLIQILEQVGKKLKNIKLIVACTKKDLGYLQAVGLPCDADEEQVKQFISSHLGLFNLVNTLGPTFKSVTYMAVSAIDDDKKSLSELMHVILKKVGI